MASPSIPPTLGRYECLVPLGRGGMAEVWVARVRGARGFEKFVAIKTMLPALLDDPGAEVMFLDEARLASRIQHPNVTEIFDLGEEAGHLFIAMEWVDGDSLAALLRADPKAPLPVSLALAIVMEAAKGLHAAHELRDADGQPIGLVHRDVSPHNVLLSRTGLVVLSDFGIAKALGHTTRTETGMVKGKPAYMAPEQALGAEVDRRADVFALGVILYELTTGTHPFRGNNQIETAERLLRLPLRRPSEIAGPSYPADLDALIVRALARDPAERFDTAEAFRVAASRVARGAAGEGTPGEIAAFLESRLGARLQERDAAIRAALARTAAVTEPRAVVSEPTVTTVPDVRRRPRSDVEAGGAAGAGTEVSLARGLIPEASDRKRRAPWIALAATFVALASLAALGIRGLSMHAPAAAPIIAAPPPVNAATSDRAADRLRPIEAPASVSATTGDQGAPSAAIASAFAGRTSPLAPTGTLNAPPPKAKPHTAKPATTSPLALTSHIPVRNPGF